LNENFKTIERYNYTAIPYSEANDTRMTRGGIDNLRKSDQFSEGLLSEYYFIFLGYRIESYSINGEISKNMFQWAVGMSSRPGFGSSSIQFEVLDYKIIDLIRNRPTFKSLINNLVERGICGVRYVMLESDDDLLEDTSSIVSNALEGSIFLCGINSFFKKMMTVELFPKSNGLNFDIFRVLICARDYNNAIFHIDWQLNKYYKNKMKNHKLYQKIDLLKSELAKIKHFFGIPPRFRELILLHNPSLSISSKMELDRSVYWKSEVQRSNNFIGVLQALRTRPMEDTAQRWYYRSGYLSDEVAD
jgi:hypothetical protein